ncbi:sulfite exporter TauE/SafE family protein [Gottschalkiaceae bacterium SANA]|nr:sulfite exporter TauE/SafE family protein [Gottschalkiaceae bacterium SANA]
MTLIAALGTIVLLAHFLEGITGFGCTVLALPFCIALIGVKTAVPVLTMLGWILALYIVITDRKSIVVKEYLKILGYVILGLPLGIFLFAYLPEAPLKILLGVFMILVAISGLVKSYWPGVGKLKVNPRLEAVVMNVFLLLGGVIHGAFSSGGPFIVTYATKKLTDKSAFRATLSAIWLTLNTIMIATNMTRGSYGQEVYEILGYMIPFLLVGLILGNIAHKRIDGASFTKMVYSVLLVSGAFMFA